MKKERSDAPKDAPKGGWVSMREGPWRKRMLKRAAVAVLILAIVGGTLYWRRAALRAHANEWSAQRHLRIAEKQLAEGNPRVALSRALTSNGLGPGRIATLRLLYEASRQVRDHGLLVFAALLHAHAEATTEDRLDTLATILEVGDFARFDEWHAALPGEVRQLPRTRLLRLRRLFAEGDSTGALRGLRFEPDLRETLEGRLLELDAHWQRGRLYDDATAAELALGLLGELKEPDERRLVFARLAVVPPSRIPREGAAKLLAAIEGDLPASLPPTLLPSLRLAAHPERREVLVRETVDLLSEDSLVELCRWLAVLGENETLLEVTDHPSAIRSAVPFELRARALLAAGRHDEALAHARYSHPEADPFEMALLEAEIAGRLGRRSDTVSAWSKAHLVAQNDLTRNLFVRLATTALAAKEESVAADAIVGGCRHPLGILPPVSEIGWVIAYLAKQDRPRELLDVTRRLLQREREDPVLLNNAVYLSLVLEQPVGSAGLDAILLLRERFPKLGALRNTLALAYLAEGRAPEALPLYDEEGAPPWQELSSAARATYALVLAETGDPEGFRRVSASVAWEDLLEQEKRFYQGRFAPWITEEEAAEPE